MEYRSASATRRTYDQSIPGMGFWSGISMMPSPPPAGSHLRAGTCEHGQYRFPHYGVSIVTADGITVSCQPGRRRQRVSRRPDLYHPHNRTTSPATVGRQPGEYSAAWDHRPRSQVATLAVRPGQSISKSMNYPNPAGKGYTHPNGEGIPRSNCSSPGRRRITGLTFIR